MIRLTQDDKNIMLSVHKGHIHFWRCLDEDELLILKRLGELTFKGYILGSLHTMNKYGKKNYGSRKKKSTAQGAPQARQQEAPSAGATEA